MQQADFGTKGSGKFRRWRMAILSLSLFGDYPDNTNSQKTQTIACQPSCLILIHPMDDFGWSGRGSKCMM
jgi:hypothetical protein